MEELEQKKAARLRFLHQLYEESGGNRIKAVKMNDIAGRIGLDVKSMRDVTLYLEGEGLMEFKTIDGGVTITHKGIVEVEGALEQPRQSTKYFPPVINVLNVHNMIGSQVQQGTTDSTQTLTNSAIDLSALRALVEQVESAALTLPLAETDRLVLQSDVETLKAQVASPKPKVSIVKETLASLRTILEGVAGNALAAALLARLPSIGS